MKKTSFLSSLKFVLVCGIIAHIAAACGKAGAQTLVDTNLTNFANGAKNGTNFVVIPFVKYDLTTKNYGYGVAGLYKVSDLFWTGLRVDRIDGLQTSAGVQGQLQTSMTLGGITLHPFIETSVGIGQSSLYGSAGTGAFVQVYSHDWTRNGKPPVTLNLGLIGDYEHVVQTGSAQDNSNQINAGPLINLSF